MSAPCRTETIIIEGNLPVGAIAAGGGSFTAADSSDTP